MVGRTGKQAADAKRQRAGFYRDAWQEAATILESDVEALDEDTLAIRKAAVATRVCLNYTPLDDPVSLRIAGNKPVVHRMLSHSGHPVPAFCEFSLSSLSAGMKFLQDHGTCVVKPASGTGGGQGVTTGIRTDRELRKAAINAGGYGPGLIIEQQIPGKNLRLLFLDGELLDAIERRGPSVTGDGGSTINQLINRMNDERIQADGALAQSIVKRDQDMRRTLADQKMKLGSIPDAGQVVTLKTVINDNSACDNNCVESELHEDVVNVARTAVNVLGLRLAGVDIVTPDHTSPLAKAGGVILEVNSTPGLYFHYAGVRRRRLVAVPILAACLDCSVDPACWKSMRDNSHLSC